jgi:hypothetical protein
MPYCTAKVKCESYLFLLAVYITRKSNGDYGLKDGGTCSSGGAFRRDFVDSGYQPKPGNH